jgi:hypothetical protein
MRIKLVQDLIKIDKIRLSNRIEHLPNMIKGDLLSVNMHCIKKHFGVERLSKKFLDEFRAYCDKNGLKFVLTELIVMELHFTKSYLDDIKYLFTDEQFTALKQEAIINILPPETKIKSSSWVLIGKE